MLESGDIPKAGAFLWTALHNKILMGDGLARIGIHGPNICLLCCADGESANHLLLNCPFASDCWDWLMQSLGWYSPRHMDLLEFLISWPIQKKRDL